MTDHPDIVVARIPPGAGEERPMDGVSWRKIWALAFAAVTPVAVLFSAIAYVLRSGSASPLTPTNALGSLSDWYFWAALAPVVVWLATRFRVRREGLFRGLAVHFAVGTTLAFGELALWLLFNRHVLGASASPDFWTAYRFTASLWAGPAFLTYLVIVAAVHAVLHNREAREREVRFANLERQLAHAQLQALRMQLQPHFLFNTLHTIAAFTREGHLDEAVRMMSTLGDLLRQTLEHGGEQVVPLRREIGFVEGYLEIERIRFGDRLTVEMEIDDRALDAQVPYMILQPIVENAMRHGIGRRSGPGRIRIRASRRRGWLRLAVRDDGPGFPAEPRPETNGGVGLRNTAARLSRLYGDRFRLMMRNAPGGGASVVVTIPDARLPADDALATGTPERRVGRPEHPDEGE
ncbi:MAG: sensor histidine kinase [Gemmatimonadota bacterium]